MTRGLCIVTGASRGIGAATAIAAAKAGWDVAVNYVANRGAATQVVNEIRECGRKAIAIQADVAQEVNVMRLFKQAEDELGAVTALVNNAGTTGKITRVEDM
ncbi:MAG: SDR family NAD(P)-dependent oxidoreductase, partial [Pseudomonadota bacterium]|nr:SDR family NAD(P)-dependent oxidoreductase [Pseudomonadota bacterium]